MRLWSLWLILPLALVVWATNQNAGGWRTASRESAHIAPEPASTAEPVLQVYGASAYGWRGWFAIHTWIAAKPAGAPRYRIYEVVGWGVDQGRPALRIYTGVPDRYWYGSRPQLLLDRRGPEVTALIKAVDEAARAYPWAAEYSVFPGPNSNTFPAWIARQVPELGLELPWRAIGQSYVEHADN